jgi:hypothetical protein
VLGVAPWATVVDVNDAGRSQEELRPPPGWGRRPAETLVRVTGFEPAASSSRTGDHSSLLCG